MNSRAFKLYILFTMSYFLHLPARIPALGYIRFDLLLVALIAVMIFLGKREEAETGGKSEIGAPLFALIVYILVSLPLVKWPGSVIKHGIPDFAKGVVFFYFTVLLVNTERRLKFFIWTFMACQMFRILEPMYLHLTQGYWGDVTYMSKYGDVMDRLSGAPSDVVNPNGLAFIIASVIPFYHYLSRGKTKLLYLALLPVFGYAMVLTGSRSGFLACALISAIIFIKSKNKVLTGAILCIAAMILVMHLHGLRKDRYLSLLEKNIKGANTVELRIEGLTGDFKVGMNRPVFGHGLGTSMEANFHERGRNQLSHNLYLEIFQELGIIGVIIFLFYIKAVFSTAIRAIRFIEEKIDGADGNFLMDMGNALFVWFLMNLLFSIASFGLSSYEWYLFGGMTVVLKRLSESAFSGVSEEAPDGPETEFTSDYEDIGERAAS